MAAFPYRAVRGLGAMQVFLSVVAVCLGIGDLVVGLVSIRWSGFWVFQMGTGIWTGLFFLVAGSLAASLGEGRTAERKIGAILTLSLLNTILFAPGLIGISIASFVQSSYFLGGPSGYRGFAVTFAQEITLTVVGCLELILSIVTVTVCFRSDPYDQKVVNQVVPMSTEFDVSAQRPSHGYAERPGTSLDPEKPSTSVLPSLSKRSSGKLVTNPVPEIGVRQARTASPVSEEED